MTTPKDPQVVPIQGAAPDEYESLVHRQLELLGEDPTRQGLVRTPERVASAMRWLMRGYDESVDELGTHLKLPPWLEAQRADIERAVPPFTLKAVKKEGGDE